MLSSRTGEFVPGLSAACGGRPVNHRRIPAGRQARRGRHGQGVSVVHARWAAGGHQGDPPRVRGGRRVPPPVRPGSAVRTAGAGTVHGTRHRRRHRRRAALAGHRVRAGALARRRGRHPWGAACRDGAPADRGHGGGPARHPWSGHRAPRSQAVQCAARRRRAPRHRFRYRPRSRRDLAHRQRRHHRHALVHGPRTGSGAQGDCGHRHLRPRTGRRVRGDGDAGFRRGDLARCALPDRP